MEIDIFLIAQTRVNYDAVNAWMERIGTTYRPGGVGGSVSDAALLVALAAKRCYLSFEPGLNPNVSKVREDLTKYLDNVLAQGHGSVLEHATFTFAVEGVSRVFTAEMNRHRAGWAISEGSLRFIRFDQSIPWWRPKMLEPDDSDDFRLARLKRDTLEIFLYAFGHQQNRYKELVDMWAVDAGDKNFAFKKKVTSLFRRIIGMGVQTGGVWTGNVRALRHVIAARTAPGAEEEIAHVFGRIARLMRDAEPMLFGDFRESISVEGESWVPKYPKV